VSPDDKDIDLTLAIFGPAGQTVTRIDNGYAGDTEVATDILLAESGRYIIEVGEFFNQPGRYTLSFVLTEEPLYGGGGRIETGQGIQSVLPINGQHLWLFDGTAEQLVSIVLEPEDNFDAILDLYGPDGRRLVALDEGFSGDAEVISGFALPITGQYSIMVRSFAGDGGSYALSLDEGGEDTLNYYDAGDLAYGDAKRETLRPHEAHAWFFQAKAGDEVMVEVAPLNDNLDLDIWLLDPGIKRLAAADSFLAGMAETIVLTLSQDGQYLVLVRDYFGEAGEYEIRLMAMPVATPEPVGMIQYDETMTAILAPGQTVIWFFNGNQGDVIDINLTPTDGNSDLIFLLQHPNGHTVLEVDEALANNAEELRSFTLTADGQWGIVVKEFFAAGGPYSLTVHETQ
jgi:hypothetical protein